MLHSNRKRWSVIHLVVRLILATNPLAFGSCTLLLRSIETSHPYGCLARSCKPSLWSIQTLFSVWGRSAFIDSFYMRNFYSSKIVTADVGHMKSCHSNYHSSFIVHIPHMMAWVLTQRCLITQSVFLAWILRDVFPTIH